MEPQIGGAQGEEPNREGLKRGRDLKWRHPRGGAWAGRGLRGEWSLRGEKPKRKEGPKRRGGVVVA